AKIAICPRDRKSLMFRAPPAPPSIPSSSLIPSNRPVRSRTIHSTTAATTVMIASATDRRNASLSTDQVSTFETTRSAQHTRGRWAGRTRPFVELAGRALFAGPEPDRAALDFAGPEPDFAGFGAVRALVEGLAVPDGDPFPGRGADARGERPDRPAVLEPEL